MKKTNKKDCYPKSPYVNKDGTVNKGYTKKMWNYVMQTMVDSFNNDIDDKEYELRTQQFQKMANNISLH